MTLSERQSPHPWLPASQASIPAADPVPADRQRYLDHWLFLPPILLVCALQWQLRLLGAAFVLIPFALFLYAVLRRSPPPWLLTFYVLLNAAIAVVSYLGWMPKSWQVFFIPELIPRQIVPLVSFYLVAWGAKAYFEQRLQQGTLLVDRTPLIVATFAISPIVMYGIGDLSYEGQALLVTVFQSYGQFPNGVTISILLMTVGMFTARIASPTTLLILAYILFSALTMGFAQFKLFAVLFLLVLAGLPARLMILGLAVAVVGAYATGLADIPGAYELDPNSAIRLLFVRDALAAIGDTWGLGIGFGMETVRWSYDFDGAAELQFLPPMESITSDELARALSTGVHNSLLQAFMRSGVIGFILLAAAFVAAVPRRSLPKPVRQHAGLTFCMIFIICLVNPGLETPLQLIGVGFAYGYLVAVNRFGAAGGFGARGGAADLQTAPSAPVQRGAAAAQPSA